MPRRNQPNHFQKPSRVSHAVQVGIRGTRECHYLIDTLEVLSYGNHEDLYASVLQLESFVQRLLLVDVRLSICDNQHPLAYARPRIAVLAVNEFLPAHF